MTDHEYPEYREWLRNLAPEQRKLVHAALLRIMDYDKDLTLLSDLEEVTLAEVEPCECTKVKSIHFWQSNRTLDALWQVDWKEGTATLIERGEEGEGSTEAEEVLCLTCFDCGNLLFDNRACAMVSEEMQRLLDFFHTDFWEKLKYRVEEDPEERKAVEERLKEVDQA